MEKITTLTKEQFQKIDKSRNPAKALLRLLEIETKHKYQLGDTLAIINNAEMLGVYKNTFREKCHYYIVVSIIDTERAFTWSVYPV